MESAVDLDSGEAVRILYTNGGILCEEALTMDKCPWSVFSMSFWRRKPGVLEYLMTIPNIKMEPYDPSKTILMEASEMMNSEVLSVVLRFSEKRTIDEVSKDWPKYTALQWCFTRASRYNENECLECVKLLVEAGADIDMAGNTNDYSQRPLCLAIQRRLQSVVLFLLQRGASIRGGHNVTALMIASEYRRDEMINLLVKHGIDVNARDDNGKSATNYCFNRVTEAGATCVLILIVLTKSGYDIKQDKELLPLASTEPECVQYMVEAGVDINYTNQEKQTVLMGVAEKEDSATVRALMRGGADVNMTDEDGLTALHYLPTPALSGDDGYDNWFLSWDALFKNWSFVSVNVPVEGETLLHRLLKAKYLLDDPHYIPAMIKAGADVNARDENNRTPLMTAVEIGCSTLVSMFIEHEADLNARDVNGRPPLHFLTTIEDNDARNKMAQVFIHYGADLNIQDSTGRTVVMIAAEKNYHYLKSLLMESGAKIKNN